MIFKFRVAVLNHQTKSFKSLYIHPPFSFYAHYIFPLTQFQTKRNLIQKGSPIFFHDFVVKQQKKQAFRIASQKKGFLKEFVEAV